MTREVENLRPEQVAIRQRIDQGEQIDLPDVLALFDIRRTRELWPLADLRAWGRAGGPTEDEIEIPPSAWVHLRWITENGDFLVITPEGKRIYELRFSAREGNGSEPLTNCATVDLDAPQGDHAPALSEEPAKAFARIVDAARPAGKPWTIEDYNRELAGAGLAVTADKRRVSGVKIVTGGRIERGGGPILLANALLVTRFRQLGETGALKGKRTKRDIARSLYSWLAVDHANLWTAGPHVGSTTLDDLLDLFRRLELRVQPGPR